MTQFTKQASDHDRDQARVICEELGGLPLALDQAGAYIEETRCGLSDYLPQYQARQAVLLCDSRHKMAAAVINCPTARFVQSIFTLKSTKRLERIISSQTLKALEKRIKSVCQNCTFGQVMPNFCTFGHLMAFLVARDFASCVLNHLLRGHDMPFLRPFNAVSHILQRRGGVVSDHPEPVATTWSLSFENVERANPAAADVLRLCAFLSADTIPEEIVVAGISLLALSEKHHKQPEKQGWLPVFLKRTRESISQQEKAFVLDDAIMVICAYSLLSRDPQTHTLSVHRLVQTVQHESMTAEEKKQWKQRAVLAVNASYPDVREVSQWDACERWLPHALVGK